MTKKAMILLYFLTVGRGQTLNQLKSSQDPDPINFSLEHNFYHIGQSDKFNHIGQSPIRYHRLNFLFKLGGSSGM